MRLTISLKIVLVTTFVLLMTLLGSAIATGILFSKEYSRALESRSLAIGQSLTSQLSRLLNLQIPLDDLPGFDNQCKTVVDRYEGISYAMVVKPDGHILYHSDRDRPIKRVPIPYSFQSAAETIKPKVRRVGAYYEAVIPVFNALVDYQASIHIGFPVRTIKTELKELLTTSGLIGLTIALFSTLILFVLLQHLVTKPLHNLIVAMQKIRRDNSWEAASNIVSRNDEIGELSAVFNELMHDLGISRTEIEAHAQQLEVTVSKRTKELRKANRELSVKVIEKDELLGKLQRAEKMEALGILAGGVAHDLNNILSGIVSYPELLMMQLPDSSSLKKPLQTIQSAGQKAAEIVEDLLTLARRGVITRQVIDINEIITEYLASPEYKKILSFHRNISVKTNLAENLLNVTGSPIHIRKLIMNLVSNAAEAQPKGGEITIKTYNHSFDLPTIGYEQIREGDFVAIVIADKGCGIADKDLDRIFEPFYTKKVMGRSGTGLGMAVVWGTVQDHLGFIDVKSNPDEGTTFMIYLPVTRDSLEKKAEPIPIDAYLGDGQAILVVDDIEEQREIAANILEMLNYSPTAVSSGETAIEYLKHHTAELILLDMIMEPGMDGLDTYKQIIEINPQQKVIIASGFSETERVKQAQKLGAGQYIKKPYSVEAIGIAVKQALSSTPDPNPEKQ